MHPNILEAVAYAKSKGIQRIALSTNGANSAGFYRLLVNAGVNDFSISLDGCCADDVDKMAGVSDVFDRVTHNIRMLAKLTYVTVGVVLNEGNIDGVLDTIRFAHSLGVADIRIISAAPA